MCRLFGTLKTPTDASPFIISSVVVGNVQYPSEVADAVARKLPATQALERKDTEIRDRTERADEARLASSGNCRSPVAAPFETASTSKVNSCSARCRSEPILNASELCRSAMEAR